MREVTFDELHGWVRKNMHHTWYHGDGPSGFDPGDGGSLAMKYINFSLDTRDMKVFRITLSGFGGKDFDFRDGGDGSILDAAQEYLDKRADARGKK